MIEVVGKATNPRSRGERTKRRNRHLSLTKENHVVYAAKVVALTNKKNLVEFMPPAVPVRHSTLQMTSTSADSAGWYLLIRNVRLGQ